MLWAGHSQVSTACYHRHVRTQTAVLQPSATSSRCNPRAESLPATAFRTRSTMHGTCGARTRRINLRDTARKPLGPPHTLRASSLAFCFASCSALSLSSGASMDRNVSIADACAPVWCRCCRIPSTDVCSFHGWACGCGCVCV